MRDVGRASPRPAASVIVLGYDVASTIRRALASLARQTCPERFEIVVVWSGDDETPRIVAREFPDVRLVGRPARLPTGAARNLGIAHASGEVIAFLAGDCEADPDWLRHRLAAHRAGFDCVGGSVVCAEPAGIVARASHLLEYAICPSSRPREVVEDEPIYNLSFRREIFARHGLYEPAVAGGEDSLFNWRLVQAGEKCLFDPRIRTIHPGPDGLLEFLRHQFWHGAWLARICRDYDFPGTRGYGIRGRCRLMCVYPAVRLVRLVRRIRRWQPHLVRATVFLSPLLLLGILAATLGLLRGWLSEPAAE